MHNLLILEAFKKAEKDTGSGIPNRLAIFLSDIVEYTSRSLLDKYNLAKENPYESVEIKQFAVQSLCEYLGYKNFEDFILYHKTEIDTTHYEKNENLSFASINDDNNSFSWFTSISRNVNSKILIPFISIVIVASIIIFYIKKPRVMVWNKDHYEQVTFDLKKYSFSDFKLYKKERVLNFKKIIPHCDSTPFFKDDGSANLWYGKDAQGKLEYFTDIGLHPETGKTLKAITPYMINKHICN